MSNVGLDPTRDANDPRQGRRRRSSRSQSKRSDAVGVMIALVGSLSVVTWIVTSNPDATPTRPREHLSSVVQARDEQAKQEEPAANTNRAEEGTGRIFLDFWQTVRN